MTEQQECTAAAVEPKSTEAPIVAAASQQVVSEQPQPHSPTQKIPWNEVGRSIRFAAPLMLFLVAVVVVAYYILFPSKGEFHSDCTDTLYWAKASYDSGSLYNTNFSYACLLPFGGSLLMLIFLPIFGVSMTTQTLGMLLFFALFLTFFCLLLREMHWSMGWICSAAAILLATLCSSEKLREIFWGHTIYYSLGILFLLIGLFLLFRLGNLAEQRRVGRIVNLSGEKQKLHLGITAVVLLIFFFLCGTDQITAITIFALPVLGALFLERLLDRQTPLSSRQNGWTLLLLLALFAATMLGMVVGKALAGEIVAEYQEAYSGYAAQAQWVTNAQKLPLAWLTLLGLEDIPDQSLMSGQSILNLLRMAVGILLWVLPIVATCCYAKYQGREGKQFRILLWAHWVMTALILVGYICGYLSAANWRLSPIVCTSLLVSLAFLHWAIRHRTKCARISGVCLIPMACFCVASMTHVAAMPYDSIRQNSLYQLANVLEGEDLTYGYASFWNANAITMISDSAVQVRDVGINGTDVTPSTYQTDATWYQDQVGQEEYFLLLTQSEYDTLSSFSAPILGESADTFQIQDSYGSLYYVLTFSENIF